MARITVEDCANQVPNKFELILLAARRAKDLSAGADPTVPREHDKNTVVALREIAAGTVSISDLRATIIENLRSPSSPNANSDSDSHIDIPNVSMEGPDEDEE
jgi:DNA-directed RNA polymerase subunit omega